MVQRADGFDLVVVGAGGCGLVAALRAAQQGARVALLEKTDRHGGGTALSSQAVGPDGAVTGVVTDKGTFSGQKVVLATGGFGASQELLGRYIPKAVGIPFPGHAGSTGDGLKMGLALGADTAHMDAFQPYPAHLGPAKRAVSPDLILAGGIMVGPGGRRFVDETRYAGGL